MMNEANSKLKKDLNAYWTWMGDDGIVRSVVKPGAEVTLEDAIENSRAVNEYFAGEKFPLLINATGIKSMTREARKYLAVNDRSTHIIAFGVVVESQLSRIIANFFFQFQRTGVPSRLFNDEHSALKWLNKFKDHK